MIEHLRASIAIIKSDTKLKVVCAIPILIGIVLYFFVGLYMYTDFLAKITAYVSELTGVQEGTSFLSYALTAVVTVFLYFFTSWTFVLLVSLISSPINDIISSRTELLITGKDEGEEFALSKVGFIIWNETKKVIAIALLALFAALLSLTSILAPIGFILSMYLVAINFLDYTWSRYDLKFFQGIALIRKAPVQYGVGGLIFMAFAAVPILNVLTLPVGVVFFTRLYIMNRNK